LNVQERLGVLGFARKRKRKIKTYSEAGYEYAHFILVFFGHCDVNFQFLPVQDSVLRVLSGIKRQPTHKCISTSPDDSSAFELVLTTSKNPFLLTAAW